MTQPITPDAKLKLAKEIQEVMKAPTLKNTEKLIMLERIVLRVTTEQKQAYKQLSKETKMPLSKIVRDTLKSVIRYKAKAPLTPGELKENFKAFQKEMGLIQFNTIIQMANKNFGGRPIGSQNKVSKELRESLKLVFDNEIELLQANLEALEPKDRIDVLIRLMPYIISKMPTETIINDTSNMKFDFEVEVLNGNGSLRERYPLNNYGNDGTEKD